MNHLYPFARKLAETMLRVKPRYWDLNSSRRLTKQQAIALARSRYFKYETHGWTQKDQEAILDRPILREP